MTDQASTKRLLGWRTENYLWETADPAVAKNWEGNIGVLPIFEGDPNTSLDARPAPVHSAHDLTMVQVPRDLHLITLGMLSSYVTTLAGIDFPDNDEGDHQQRLNETKRAAVNSAIAKLRALITGSTA